jgi:hypothetical protein
MRFAANLIILVEELLDIYRIYVFEMFSAGTKSDLMYR